MMKLTLSDLEHQQLDTTFKTTSAPRLHHRCQAILMAARGRRHSHIAEDLAVQPTHRPTLAQRLSSRRA
jgi:hypothetical protein